MIGVDDGHHSKSSTVTSAELLCGPQQMLRVELPVRVFTLAIDDLGGATSGDARCPAFVITHVYVERMRLTRKFFSDCIVRRARDKRSSFRKSSKSLKQSFRSF